MQHLRNEITDMLNDLVPEVGIDSIGVSTKLAIDRPSALLPASRILPAEQDEVPPPGPS